jgi:hypothetical protein
VELGFDGRCDVVDLGYPVTTTKIAGLSVGDNQVSSVRTGSAVGVRLWDRNLGFGGSQLIARNSSVNALTSFNDLTSSMAVELGTCATAGDFCAADAFCDPQGANACGAQYGVCTIKPTTCPSTIAPVCGCDGITYGNDCERKAAGFRKYLDGYCP